MTWHQHTTAHHSAPQQAYHSPYMRLAMMAAWRLPSAGLCWRAVHWSWMAGRPAARLPARRPHSAAPTCLTWPACLALRLCLCVCGCAGAQRLVKARAAAPAGLAGAGQQPPAGGCNPWLCCGAGGWGTSCLLEYMLRALSLEVVSNQLATLPSSLCSQMPSTAASLPPLLLLSAAAGGDL